MNIIPSYGRYKPPLLQGIIKGMKYREYGSYGVLLIDTTFKSYRVHVDITQKFVGNNNKLLYNSVKE